MSTVGPLKGRVVCPTVGSCRRPCTAFRTRPSAAAGVFAALVGPPPPRGEPPASRVAAATLAWVGPGGGSVALLAASTPLGVRRGTTRTAPARPLGASRPRHTGGKGVCAATLLGGPVPVATAPGPTAFCGAGARPGRLASVLTMTRPPCPTPRGARRSSHRACPDGLAPATAPFHPATARRDAQVVDAAAPGTLRAP